MNTNRSIIIGWVSPFVKVFLRNSTKLLLIFFLLIVQIPFSQSAGAATTTTSTTHDNISDADDLLHKLDEEEEMEHEYEPGHAVLFPCFTVTLGIIVFYVLSRYARSLPYTAIMFLIGTILGIFATIRSSNNNHILESIRLWIPIDSEVLLLVFLPGLIFKDSIGQNVHLFQLSIIQLLIFAFPLVLAGTTLTALIAYYIFPYGWSFNLAMTFGSILSATDPVAVAALLEEVGAPPRLKVHVAGESLLNDGAAIVFFGIFSARFLFELGIDGLGKEVDLPLGIGLFCRKALGGAAIGLGFGIGLLVLLFMLTRRFNREENVVEVSATIGVAYLCYYVAEPVCETSGVIATLVAGLTVKSMGRGMINDMKLLDDFWTLVEHLLNTVLFTLGGTVWGAVVADGEQRQLFTSKDWGNLILLYVLLLIIRGLLFFSVFPIISRIGLKTNWKETLFQVYGGLRGAVGIALALFLNKEVIEHGGGEYTDASQQTARLFLMVGGIAFLTLIINGPTAGPLLVKLGLADSTEVRDKILSAYKVHTRFQAINDFVQLLTQERFRMVNFALVKEHVPMLADLTKDELLEAAERYKDTTLPEDYNVPHLHRILPYLPDGDGDDDDNNNNNNQNENTIEEGPMDGTYESHKHYHKKCQQELRVKNRRERHNRRSSTMRFMQGEEPLSVKELRVLFVSILRAAYDSQIEEGELEISQFLALVLLQSLDFAEDAVANGESLKDWDYVTLVDQPISSFLSYLPLAKQKKLMKYSINRISIERSLSFMEAHRRAQKIFQEEFETKVERDLSEGVKIVIQESKDQWAKAQGALSKYDSKMLELEVSHRFCAILVNRGVFHIEKLVHIGLLKEQEAEPLVEEAEELLHHIHECDKEKHAGEFDIDDESDVNENGTEEN